MCSWGLTEGRSLREAARRNTGAHLFFPSRRSPPPRSPVNLFCETQPCLSGSLTPPLSPEMGSVMQAGSYLQGGRKRSAEDEADGMQFLCGGTMKWINTEPWLDVILEPVKSRYQYMWISHAFLHRPNFSFFFFFFSVTFLFFFFSGQYHTCKQMSPPPPRVRTISPAFRAYSITLSSIRGHNICREISQSVWQRLIFTWWIGWSRLDEISPLKTKENAFWCLQWEMKKGRRGEVGVWRRTQECDGDFKRSAAEIRRNKTGL